MASRNSSSAGSLRSSRVSPWERKSITALATGSGYLPLAARNACRPAARRDRPASDGVMRYVLMSLATAETACARPSTAAASACCTRFVAASGK